MHTNDSKLLEEIGELLALHYEDWQVQDHRGPEVAFGRYLRSLRHVYGWGIAEVAAQANVAESELLAYERGLIPKRWIKESSLTTLAKTLGEEIDNFLLLLEADNVNETAPKPTEGAGGKPDQHGANHAPGCVAVSTGGGLLWKNLVLAHKAKPPRPCSGVQMVVRTKPSLRQVLGDPRWQGKVYRVWMPLVALLLFFCLQLQTFHVQELQQPDLPPSSSAVIESVPDETLMLRKLYLPLSNLSDDRKGQFPHLTGLRDLSGVAEPLLRQFLTFEITTPQDKVTVRLPANSFIQPDEPSVGPLPRQEVQYVWRLSANAKTPPIQPATGYPGQIAAHILQPSTTDEKWRILPIDLPLEEPPLPLVHTVASGEGLACIANHYFERESFYPLLCLYNFGSLACSQPLQPGDQLKIPAFADFDLADPQVNQALTHLLPSLINDFTLISPATILRNQTERLRGIDYFCQADDYQRYGKQLVLDGQIENPELRIPKWSVTREPSDEPAQPSPALPAING